MVRKLALGKRVTIGAPASIANSYVTNNPIQGAALVPCPSGSYPVPTAFGGFTCVKLTGRSITPPPSM